MRCESSYARTEDFSRGIMTSFHDKHHIALLGLFLTIRAV